MGRSGRQSTAQSRPAMYGGRLQSIDALRGSAIVLMVIYHFSFDLDYFGVADFDFNHSPWWHAFRIVIVSTFLSLVGFSLQLASRHGLNVRRYLQRLGWLVLCASLVSLASYLMFPRSMIFFGILHFIALASIAGLLFVRFHLLSLVTGIGIIVMGVTVQDSLFNMPWLQWLGMMTHKPITEDYVPFVPWFGVVLIGMWAGKTFVEMSQPTLLMTVFPHAAVRALAWAGNRSLLIYMVHQPILIGSLWLLLRH